MAVDVNSVTAAGLALFNLFGQGQTASTGNPPQNSVPPTSAAPTNAGTPPAAPSSWLPQHWVGLAVIGGILLMFFFGVLVIVTRPRGRS